MTGIILVGCLMGQCITPVPLWNSDNSTTVRGRGMGGLALNRGNCYLKKRNPKQTPKLKQATFAHYLYGEGFSWRMWLELIYIYFP